MAAPSSYANGRIKDSSAKVTVTTQSSFKTKAVAIATPHEVTVAQSRSCFVEQVSDCRSDSEQWPTEAWIQVLVGLLSIA